MTTKKDNESSSVRRTREGFFSVRIRAGRHPRTGKSQQVRVTVATRDERVFAERLTRLRELSATLVPAGLTAAAKVALRKAASQETDERFDFACRTALEFAPVAAQVAKAGQRWHTFRELGEAWTSGVLHRRWPDHVKKKRTADDDKGRLAVLYEMVVDDKGRKLGDLPLAEITVEHADAAMSQVPATSKRPAARKQWAQCIGRVLKLAVFPTACLAASPLPKNFLPAVPKGDLLFQHLYPDEDLRLMRCEALDYAERCFIGLGNREGGRLGEFLRKLKWTGIDTARGTITLPGGTHRKGGKPSKWHAEPGSLEALEPLRALGNEGPFTHLPDDRKWAERVQDMMRTAGLDREALFYSNVDEGLRRLRAHDAGRATYVTLALGSGLSEKHIMARTAHTTSGQIHNYDHAAEALTASESGCKLMPLDYALGLYRGDGALPEPGERRAGWMTLDPRSPEAARLEALALAPEATVVPLLGAAGGGRSGGPRLLEATTPANDDRSFDGALDGELLDEQDRAMLVAPAEPAPLRAVGGLRGETRSVTSAVFGVAARALAVVESSRFDAAVREPRVELGCLAAPEPKSVLSMQEGARDDLSARSLVTGSDGKTQEVTPPTPEVRPENAAPATPPAPPDPVLAALLAAAHAAVDRGDRAAVAELMDAVAVRRSELSGRWGVA